MEDPLTAEIRMRHVVKLKRKVSIVFQLKFRSERCMMVYDDLK